MEALFRDLPLPALRWRRTDGNIVLVDSNAAANDEVGDKLISRRNAPLHDVFNDGDETSEIIQRAFDERQTVCREISFRFAWRQELRIAQVTSIPVSESEVVTVIEDRSALRDAQEALLLASRTDSLTGLYTRRIFREMVETEHGRTRRYGRPYSIALIDVDNYTAVNRERGQDSGDEILVRTADLLRENLRDQDRICRWEGGVFAALLPETEIDEARTVAEKIRLAVEESDQPVTVSVGIVCNDGAVEPEKTMQTADQRLRRAKDRGRNCVESA